jgi:uncharacterized protein (DUF952 family)
MSDKLVFKILTQQQCLDAQSNGVFHGAPIDIADGYIHLSTAQQAQETADKHFAGMDGLMLAAVDAAALGGALVYELSRGDALFPHLYGPLDLKNVLWVKPMPLGANGKHKLADLLA